VLPELRQLFAILKENLTQLKKSKRDSLELHKLDGMFGLTDLLSKVRNFEEKKKFFATILLLRRSDTIKTLDPIEKL
jgi:hypothetical protein